MRFGEFLLSRGRISKKDMDEACRAQIVNNHLIGVLAMDHGMLRPDELEHILDHQARAVDKPRFGEVAIGLGYLGREDLEELLTIQAENRLRIGDVLVLQSRLTEQELLAELRAYREIMRQNKVA
jgi:hypothetical protein